MNDQVYLKEVIALAETSTEPIKCAAILINRNGEVIARAINSQRNDNLIAAHAEMKAIAIANKKMGRKLHGLHAYCNCEPCPMCLTAFIFAEVERVVFANRLNDIVDVEHKINIDSFEFIKKFRHQLKLEYIQFKKI